MVSPEFAKQSGGLCESCVSEGTAANRSSPYHDKLSTPAQLLDYEQKRTQLLGALKWQNEQRLEELFNIHDIKFFGEPPTNYHNWMNTAVFYGCGISILEKLVSAGCEVHTQPKSPDPTCSLWLAINKYDLQLVEWLLKRGAKPNRSSALLAAIHLKDIDLKLKTLQLLFEYGANANRVFRLYDDKTQRYTVLDCESHPSVLKLLESNGAKHFKELDRSG